MRDGVRQRPRRVRLSFKGERSTLSNAQGKVGGRGDRGYSRELLEAGEKSGVKRANIAALKVRVCREAGAERQHVFRVESRIHIQQFVETAHQQSTADEKHHREPKLRGDESAEDPSLPQSQRAGAPSLLQCVRPARSRRFEGGQQSAQQRGGNCQKAGETQDAPVNADLIEPRQGIRCGGDQRGDHPSRHGQTENSAEQCQYADSTSVCQ